MIITHNKRKTLISIKTISIFWNLNTKIIYNEKINVAISRIQGVLENIWYELKK